MCLSNDSRVFHWVFMFDPESGKKIIKHTDRFQKEKKQAKRNLKN